MWKREIKFSPDQTPQQRAYQLEWTQRDDASKAALCNLLMFWRRCPVRACRRNHACSHDPQACFDRHWPHVPETDKIWLRGFVKAQKDKLPLEQAIERANAEVARVAEMEAAAQRAFENRAAPTEAQRDEPPTPRVRSL